MGKATNIGKVIVGTAFTVAALRANPVSTTQEVLVKQQQKIEQIQRQERKRQGQSQRNEYYTSQK